MKTVTYASSPLSEDLPTPSLHLELMDTARAHTVEGPYGALVVTMASPSMSPPPHTHALAAPCVPSSAARARALLQSLPLSVWKRVALYSLLFLGLGNLLGGGLSLAAALGCVALVALGLAGVVAHVAARERGDDEAPLF
jgi:hypothetical protein